ncbi:hypothetical protein IEQ34_015821 [Dendrobium chrysotoxum]|uniref:Uncharacterized protein n=1 Tax=Dendrobium chrysotoxum TaxID=161865 RepID=A0AAV7G1U2_DENCH|nr:hypothetical protein IEQ34_015821 [Dendrobium chrysotoxum]
MGQACGSFADCRGREVFRDDWGGVRNQKWKESKKVANGEEEGKGLLWSSRVWERNEEGLHSTSF